MIASGYFDDMLPPTDDRSEVSDVDPDAPGAFVDDEEADEVPEPNEPA